MPTKDFIVEDYGIDRRLVADSMYLAKKVNKMVVHFEVDVTELRNKLKAFKKQHNNNISLITIFLFCYAKTLQQNQRCHAIKGKNKLFLFKNIDIFFPFEIENPTSPQKNVARKIIREANTKSIFELQQEIDAMQQQTSLMTAPEKRAMQLPLFLRKLIYNFIFANPLKRKQLFGNAYFSAALNVAPNSLTTAFPIHFHSMGAFVCPIFTETKNGVTTSKTNIIVSADHVIINGSDLFRFANELGNTIKNFSF